MRAVRRTSFAASRERPASDTCIDIVPADPRWEPAQAEAIALAVSRMLGGCQAVTWRLDAGVRFVHLLDEAQRVHRPRAEVDAEAIARMLNSLRRGLDRGRQDPPGSRHRRRQPARLARSFVLGLFKHS